MICHRLLPALLAAVAAGAQAQGPYFNETAGGPLRPGVYGRIKVGQGAPPPLISPRPVVALKELGPVRGEPLYLYLPPGQVRKWSRYCERYAACERPVYFVRVDENPGKLGRWKTREKLDRLLERDGMHLAGVDARF
jgi:hypothetical protein